MPGESPSTVLQYTSIGIFVAFVLYAVMYYSRSINSNLTSPRDTNAGLTHIDAVTASPIQQGLRHDDIAVLPTFTYHASPIRGGCKAKAASEAVQCAVCLDELGDGALVRVLPSCRHFFHAGCIDVWLLSHPTCPVCRASPEHQRVLLGTASLSPPLPQLRRCGASPERAVATTSRAKDAALRSPSPVWSPMPFEISVDTGNASSLMSPSPPLPKTPEGEMRRSRSPSPVVPRMSASPVTTGSHKFEV